MKKGFTLVELVEKLIFVILCVAVFWFVFSVIDPWLRARVRITVATPSFCIERPLKQFVVDQDDFSGSFFLASGSIDGGEKECYFRYKTKNSNEFRMASVPTSKASIIIEDGQSRVIFVTAPLDKRFMGRSRSSIERNIDSGYFGSITEFEFHVPPGSIFEEYDPNFSSSF